jgi:4-amino-4-deoxy-L-arabinose transferase-like glycosyltransferase
VIILLASVILRLFSALYLGNQMMNLPGTYDQVSYHVLAQRLIAGHGFSFGQQWWPLTAPDAPTAHWSFLYTFYLALVYKLFGANPLAARVIQAVIVGLLHPFLAYLIGKRLFSTAVGLAAAGLTAVYIYYIYYTGALMTEPFYISAILCSLYLAILITDLLPEKPTSIRWAYALGLGFSLGAAVLLRQIFFIFIPFLYLWIVLAGKRKGLPLIRMLMVTTALVVAMIIPFTIFNYARFDRFVLLNTNAGFAFFWGNHPIYGSHFIPILTPDMASYQELVPVELRSLDEAALDQALLRRGIQFILDDPGRYIRLSISRIPPYFMFWPSSGSALISNFSRVLSFGLYLPFMIYGVVLSVTRLPRKIGEFIASPVALLLGFALVYTTIHILSWTLIRYRLPVDAVLIIFAGLALCDIAERLGVRLNISRRLEYSR